MAAFGICGKIVAVEGKGGELEQCLLGAAAALEQTPQCQLYLVNRAVDEPDSVWVVEIWDSAEAHQASLELHAVRTLIARARPIIADMPERTEMHTVGGKGLPAPSRSIERQ